MTSRDFCYWLQGYLEVSAVGGNDPAKKVTAPLNPMQVEMIQKHLNLVFTHEIDPSYGDKQDLLNQIHSGTSNSGGDVLVRC